MPKPLHKPRVAVLSPFVDKSHGTERCLAEQIERLAGDYEIHLYSSHVEDVNLEQIVWHRVPLPPGPHLLRFIWWFVANHIYRWSDRQLHGIAPDLIYTAGVNCLDADVISVHIVFSEFWDHVREELSLRSNPVKTWPVLLHRRLYYSLIEFLERRVYRKQRVAMSAVSGKTAQAVKDYCGRTAPVEVIYNGIDRGKFNPQRRTELRASARTSLGLAKEAFAVLLVGNDWKNKGLPCLIEAASRMNNPQLRIVVVGHDIKAPFEAIINRLGLAGRVVFAPPRPDVEFYYAAADLYAGPSLEDAFSLPPAEAMSCGMAVITSRSAGVSEIIHHGVDGIILEDPADVQTLSEWLRRLADDADMRCRLGEAAARTAAQYTWEQNALQLQALFERTRISRSLA